MIAAPLDVQVSVLGTWPLCQVYPQFCVAPGDETYMLYVKASRPEVVGFLYHFEYVQDGVTKTHKGKLWRNDSATGYTNTHPIKLGRIDKLISVVADEVIVQ